MGVYEGIWGAGGSLVELMAWVFGYGEALEGYRGSACPGQPIREAVGSGLGLPIEPPGNGKKGRSHCSECPRSCPSSGARQLLLQPLDGRDPAWQLGPVMPLHDGNQH